MFCNEDADERTTRRPHRQSRVCQAEQAMFAGGDQSGQLSVKRFLPQISLNTLTSNLQVSLVTMWEVPRLGEVSWRERSASDPPRDLIARTPYSSLSRSTSINHLFMQYQWHTMKSKLRGLCVAPLACGNNEHIALLFTSRTGRNSSSNTLFSMLIKSC